MRRRLVVAIAGVAAVAVAAPRRAARRSCSQRNYRDEELLRLQRDTVAATRAIDVPAAGGDPVELPRDRRRLAVYDRAGSRLAGAGPRSAPPMVRTALRGGRVADASGNGRLTVGRTAAERRARDRRRAGRALRRRGRERRPRGVAPARRRGARHHRRRRARGRLCSPAGWRRRWSGSPRRRDGSARVTSRSRTERAGVPEVDEVAAALDATAARLDELVHARAGVQRRRVAPAADPAARRCASSSRPSSCAATRPPRSPRPSLRSTVSTSRSTPCSPWRATRNAGRRSPTSSCCWTRRSPLARAARDRRAGAARPDAGRGGAGAGIGARRRRGARRPARQRRAPRGRRGHRRACTAATAGYPST